MFLNLTAPCKSNSAGRVDDIFHSWDSWVVQTKKVFWHWSVLLQDETRLFKTLEDFRFDFEFELRNSENGEEPALQLSFGIQSCRRQSFVLVHCCYCLMVLFLTCHVLACWVIMDFGLHLDIEIIIFIHENIILHVIIITSHPAVCFFQCPPPVRSMTPKMLIMILKFLVYSVCIYIYAFLSSYQVILIKIT